VYLVAYICARVVMPLKCLKGKRQTVWVRDGEGKGMVLCSSRMAALRRGNYSISCIFPGGKKNLGGMYRQLWKRKTF